METNQKHLDIIFILVSLLLVCAVGLPAQQEETNYDESKVPTYSLPDPLVLSDGKRVKDAQTWWKSRRATTEPVADISSLTITRPDGSVFAQVSNWVRHLEFCERLDGNPARHVVVRGQAYLPHLGKTVAVCVRMQFHPGGWKSVFVSILSGKYPGRARSTGGGLKIGDLGNPTGLIIVDK